MIAEYVTRDARNDLRVLSIRTASAPKNMFNGFVFIALDIIILFQ